jgi:plastocyanin
MTKIPALALVALALVLGLAACGSSSSSTTSSTAPATSSSAAGSASGSAPAAGALADAADPGGALKFTKSSLSAKAGKVTIDFTNSSSVPHNFTVQQGTSGPEVGGTPTIQGGSKTLTVTLKPGTYTFFCTIPGHRAAGMQGTLTVS